MRGAARPKSFARVLRGLSRSVSPDAIVDAIVEEVGEGTGADYVAVVRRRPEGRVLEAVLSPTRPGAAASRTTMGLRELEDPAQEQAMTELSIAASRGVPGAGTRGRRRVAATPPAADADQRIADRIAGQLRDTYGLSNTRAAPLRVNGRVEGAIVLARRKGGVVAVQRRRLPQRCGDRGLGGACPGLHPARCRGPSHHRRPDGPARTDATSTSTWGSWPGAGAPRTGSVC